MVSIFLLSKCNVMPSPPLFQCLVSFFFRTFQIIVLAMPSVFSIALIHFQFIACFSPIDSPLDFESSVVKSRPQTKSRFPKLLIAINLTGHITRMNQKVPCSKLFNTPQCKYQEIFDLLSHTELLIIDIFSVYLKRKKSGLAIAVLSEEMLHIHTSSTITLHI